MRRASQRGRGPTKDPHGFLRAVRLVRDDIASFDAFPFAIPAIRELDELELHPKVTFLVGENGSGKSTLLEAIAVAAGFNAEGGSKNFNFATRPGDDRLAAHLRLVRGLRRATDGFFLRAESFFNAATYLEETDPSLLGAYGGRSLHAQSHGEAFLALAQHRFRGDGLYLLDEPEAALSPSRQLSLLKIIQRLVELTGSQLLIASHSPILLAYPGALLYQLGPTGIDRVAYEETEHFQITKSFLDSRERFFAHLFTERPAGDDEGGGDD